MIPALPPSWRPILGDEISKPYFEALAAFVAKEQKEHEVFPPAADIFNALVLTPYPAVKALILGQDPYHDTGQAHGLAFSVRENVPPPPSLRNIFKELHSDTGAPVPNNGCLIPWAKEGVLLLNATLTVRAHAANSHKGKGWEKFTDRVIQALNERDQPMVFVLWGNSAKAKMGFIDPHKHMLITGVHPSPLSARNGFFGSHPFTKINKFLEDHGIPPIDWTIPDIKK